MKPHLFQFSSAVRLSFVCLLISTSSFCLAAAAQSKPPGAAIASANKLATQAGIEVLRKGGNAFDAAVAVSAALSVVEPESSGLGGGAFALLHFASDGRDVFVDARETAPSAASREMYLDQQKQANRELSVNGPLAAAIPGLPAALVHVSNKYGKLKIAQNLAPAIRYAEQGFRWGDKNTAMAGFRTDTLKKYAGSAAQFLRDGAPIKNGTLVKLPDLGKTLKLIVQQGHAGFYQGEFANKLVAGVNAEGGIWKIADLAQYQIKEREPLHFQYGDYQFVTAPPPSSGGIALASIFNILSGFDLNGKSRVEKTHLLVEAMRRAYRDRAIYLGDPDFAKIPTEMLMSPYYAAGLRASINPDKATPSDLLPGISMKAGGTDTTHFSIIDRDGNMVAWTQTVNLPFGSGVVIPGTGFLLNNEMDDFSVKPGTPNAFGLVGDDANAIEPNKRPLSSMTPTFLIGKNRTAVIGTPGGSRIITMVLIGLMELMDGKDAQAAANAPRFHHQYLPDAISAEPGALTDEELKALQARGFVVSANERTWGNMQIVLWDKVKNTVEGGSDARWKSVGGASVFR
jgi:gamma-glutamyltranspeptidase / glutathione hydrolase